MLNMKIVFDKKPTNKPLVSIILLDWSCRESFHLLHYINDQVIPRDQYEVIWIEYYDRQSSEIVSRLNEYASLNKHPVIDKWIVLEMPQEYYYHKHLMYNVGMLYSSGDIIVICDSDGIVRPTFIQSIVAEFAKDPNIVLHLDQLRNFDRSYYPFNYQPIDEIEKGSANLLNGKPHGLWDTKDILHTRNYGACFCAKRDDIIAIGGSDEHIDYLGHVCGPYELTFRLVNAGKQEKWHQTEWMYHVWHPGQAGDKNFVGPHDGTMMSTTAMKIIESKRREPLVENEFIRAMRQSAHNVCQVPPAELMRTILGSERIQKWKIDYGTMNQSVFPCFDHDIAVYSCIETGDMNQPEISVVLPTLRPDKALKCIDRIAETSGGVNYQVVVVSSLDMAALLAGCKGYDRIRFVKEEKKEGSCKANTLGYENATGKYVFAIADDHLIGQGCLENLVKFMQPHDSEMFLAGARVYGVYGPGDEHTVYGFYYPYNPCIRRDLVERVGGFYDPYYKAYYGDPDLAMRVWHNGGKVELCLNAWVEFHNDVDTVDLESHADYAQRDFYAFFKRWHPIYGHLVASSDERDINVENGYALPGMPPEKCTRLVVALRKLDCPALKSELASNENIFVTKEYLFYVYKEAINYLSLLPSDIQQAFAKWLINQLLSRTSIPELVINEMLEIYRLGKYQEYNHNMEPENFLLTTIAMFILNQKGGLSRDPELAIENYKGINIIYSSRQYHAWPCSFGAFTVKIFKSTFDKFVFCEPTMYQVIKKIDDLIGGNPLVDWEKARTVEEGLSAFDFNSPEPDKTNSLELAILPNEICLKLICCLKSKNWTDMENLLNNPSETFIIRNYAYGVYNEVLRNIAVLPAKIILLLSQWLYDQLKVFEEQDYNISLIEEGYREYNILYWKGLFFGWPWSAGWFTFDRYLAGIAPAAVAGNSINEVKYLIDQKLSPPNSEGGTLQNLISYSLGKPKEQAGDIRLVVHGYRQYNIVCCKDLYYGWPWSAGGFSFERYSSGFAPTAVVSNSVVKVKDLIDQKLGLPTVEEENEHDWIAAQHAEAQKKEGKRMHDIKEEQDNDIRLVMHGYRQYNIVYCDGLYYGWPWSAEGFTLDRYLSGIAPASVVGKAMQEAKNLIDLKLGPPAPAEENQHDWAAAQLLDDAWKRTGKTDEGLPYTDLRLVVQGYRQYNIVHCKGLYFGWSWSAGGFTLDRYVLGIAPAAVVGKSINEAKNLIDGKLGTPIQEEENQHNWSLNSQIEDACENERQCVENFQNGLTAIDNLPVIIIASVAFGCNLRCKMCYLQSNHELAYDGSRERRAMSEVTFAEVLKLFPKVQDALMTVEGEILLHKNWYRRWLKEIEPYPNIKLSFQTNGMLMNEDDVDEIMNNPRIVHIAFSVDGATAPVNDSIRCGSSLEKIVNNISMLIKAKQKLNRYLPNIHTHFVMMKDNIHELPAYVKRMIELGVNSIGARHIIVYHKEQIKNSLYFYQDLCDEMILKAREIANSYGVEVGLPQTFAEAKQINRTTRPKCMDPWRHGQILHDGGLYSCCNNAVLMGNINDGGFAKVWNNEKFQRLRASVNSDNPEFTMCKYCNAMLPINCFEAHVYTKLLFELIENNELDQWCPQPVRLLIRPGEKMVE